MNNDRELLELAAKAAGYWSDGCWNGQPHRAWNPLTDDGDALRLAVVLGLEVRMSETARDTQVHKRFRTVFLEKWGKDLYAATRRAIVRAAAEIGRDME